MSIELHCPHCSKLIRAPTDASGKHGNCPYCHQSVYIPSPADDQDVIALAPIDQGEERRAEKLRQESLEFIANVDRAPSRIAGDTEATGLQGEGRTVPPTDDSDISGDIERYVLAMKESKLEDAEQVARSLRRAGKRAKDRIEALLVDEMASPVEGVPVPLMKGFLKKLLDDLR